jgi:hypothetical protein
MMHQIIGGRMIVMAESRFHATPGADVICCLLNLETRRRDAREASWRHALPAQIVSRWSPATLPNAARLGVRRDRTPCPSCTTKAMSAGVPGRCRHQQSNANAARESAPSPWRAGIGNPSAAFFTRTPHGHGVARRRLAAVGSLRTGILDMRCGPSALTNWQHAKLARHIGLGGRGRSEDPRPGHPLSRYASLRSLCSRIRTKMLISRALPWSSVFVA